MPNTPYVILPGTEILAVAVNNASFAVTMSPTTALMDVFRDTMAVFNSFNFSAVGSSLFSFTSDFVRLPNMSKPFLYTTFALLTSNCLGIKGVTSDKINCWYSLFFCFLSDSLVINSPISDCKAVFSVSDSDKNDNFAILVALAFAESILISESNASNTKPFFSSNFFETSRGSPSSVVMFLFFIPFRQ